MGGTGANFFAIATADMAWFNVAGTVATPPANQIENPNPMAQTPNFYSQDGYSGGSYVNCSDSTQPGVGAILSFLGTTGVKSNCDAGKYYLVNNYGLGYDMDGNAQPIGAEQLHAAAADRADDRRGARRQGRELEVVHRRPRSRPTSPPTPPPSACRWPWPRARSTTPSATRWWPRATCRAARA